MNSALPRVGTELRPLGALVEFLDHRRKPVKAEDRKPGPYPYFGANGQQDSVSDYIFDEPLILLAEDGGHFEEPRRGIAYQVRGKCWVNNHAHVIRPCTDVVNIDYLTRVLENYDVRKYVSGTTRLKLTKGMAERIQVPVPPLEEQRRIAEILDLADGLRAKRRAALAEVEQLTQAVFLEMFGDVVTCPRLDIRFPIAGLGSIAEIRGGITLGRNLEMHETLKLPYLRVANVQDGYLNLDEIKEIDVKASEVERYLLKPGDVLMTEGGDHDKLGRGAVWSGEVENCVHQNHLFKVRVNKESLIPSYFATLIRTRYAKDYFLRSSKKTTNLATINSTQLKAFGVPLPPLELQQDFAQRVQAIETLKASYQRSLAEMDALFASLQSRAFKGEL